MATLTLMPADGDGEGQHLAQLVWKHFESEICETLREVTEELGEQGRDEGDVREEK
jgi:hypothetical protein